MPTEAEAKFLLAADLPATAILRFLEKQGYTVRPGPVVDQVDRYWDTAAWDLWRQGWACRWRQRGPERLVGLKALTAADGLLHRRAEAEAEVAAFPAPALPLPLPALAGLLDDSAAPLQELFRVETNRRTFFADGAACRLEVCFDRTLVAAPGQPRQTGQPRFFELELELLRGREDALRRTAAALQGQEGVRPAPQSKFERGLRTAGLRPPAAAPD